MESLDELLVPDRFDMLQRRASGQLRNMVVPVDEALEQIDALARDLRVAARGGFIIVRGDSGSGKSTFLNTLDLFRTVEVVGLSPETSIASSLRSLAPTRFPFRVLVVEGREALRDVRRGQLESDVHEINTFIRQACGERTLIAWQCNADDLEATLKEIAERVGGDTLVAPIDDPVFRFQGPRRDQYIDIAQRTIATLNAGASLQDIGVSEERAQQLKDMAPTIGSFLWLLRNELLQRTETIDLIKRRHHWLGSYPDVLALYEEAVRKYADGIFLRNVLDDLRLAIELLLKSIFGNNKSLENQIPQLGEFIKKRGGSGELVNMLVKLVDYYTKYQNTYVKHDDAVIRDEVDFIFELTSSVMRHLVRLSFKKVI